MTRHPTKTLLFLLAGWLTFTCAHAELRLSVASNYRAPIEEVAEQLKRQHGIHCQLSFSSSGKLYAQILHGKPTDIFLSADQLKPQALYKALKSEKQNHIQPPKTYAKGQLYLASRTQFSDWKTAIATLKASKNRVALANPKHAPYGGVTKKLMQQLHLSNPQILGENVAQAYQFFHTGAVDYAFISSAQALNKSHNNAYFIPVPESLSPRIDQALLILNNTKETEVFLQFLQSPDYQEILQKYGYTL